MDQPPPYPGPPIQQNQLQQSSVGEGYGSEYQKQPAFKKPADDKIPQKHELEAGGQSHERQGRRGKTGEQNMGIRRRKILL